MNTHTTGATPKFRPEESIDSTLIRLSIWAAASVELLHCAADFPHLPGARDPDRLRIVADTLADVAGELRGLTGIRGAA